MSNITLTPSQSPSIPSVYRLVRDMKCQTCICKRDTDSESVTEYSFSISSREGHELSNITLTPSQSPNAAANQLDIF